LSARRSVCAPTAVNFTNSQTTRRFFMQRFISFRKFAVVLAALGALALTAPRLVAQEVPFHLDGTFTFSVKGNRVDASGDGRATPGGRFTFHDLVRSEYGGKEISGTLTFNFASGSSLTIYYEAPVESYGDHLFVEGPYSVVGGTGFFEGATGSGIIWYPIGQGAPFTLDGTLAR
jgi:hypothetical protein